MDTESLNTAREILTELSDFLHTYEGEAGGAAPEFGRYLQGKSAGGDIHNGMDDLMVGMGLVALSNLVRARMNHFVSRSPFATFMDYQYLYILKEHGEMSKSELITANFMEMSSGIEVVKRLLKKGWINESPHPRDQRAKLIGLTAEGSAVLEDHAEEAWGLYCSFSKGLSDADTAAVASLLQDLLAAGKR